MSSRPAEDETPVAPAQLTEWRKQAEQHLRGGIARLSATAPKDAAPPELIFAKLSLAQIVISLGQDAEAIELLLDEPQSVLKAITVADEASRPEKGVQSRQFATESLKLLLRAYIGGGKLDEARDTMRTLEKVAGAEAGADVTELYVGLGKLLRDELDRFREAGETERFNKLMTSFETFLNDLYQRKEGQTFGSLSWIGETYFALGEASTTDPSRAATYFERAGRAFQDILGQAETQSDYLQPDQVLAVKVRLARCFRLKRDYEAAEQLLAEVLKQRDKDLRAQVEAAYLYQDWGTHEDADKLLVAIAGKPELLIWGWGNLGNRLQNSLDRGRSEFLPTFVEARVNGTLCRFRYAQAQTDPKKRSAELEKCEIELIATVTVVKGLSDEQFAQFNSLYHKVLREAGKPVADLQPTQDVDATAVAATDQPAAKKKAAAVAPPPAPAPISMTGPLIGLAVAVLLGAGIIGWAMIYRKKPHYSAIASPEKLASFAGISASAPLAVGPPPSAPKPKPRTAQTNAPARSATAKPAARPKPKPPEQA
jgi:tetratricopeptide (TPR) repeat protein